MEVGKEWMKVVTWKVTIAMGRMAGDGDGLMKVVNREDEGGLGGGILSQGGCSAMGRRWC